MHTVFSFFCTCFFFDCECDFEYFFCLGLLLFWIHKRRNISSFFLARRLFIVSFCYFRFLKIADEKSIHTRNISQITRRQQIERKLSFPFQPWQVDSKNRLETEGWLVTIAASIDPTAHFTELLLWLGNSQDFSSGHCGDDFFTCSEHNDTRNTELRFRLGAERASRDHKYSCTVLLLVFPSPTPTSALVVLGTDRGNFFLLSHFTGDTNFLLQTIRHDDLITHDFIELSSESCKP